MKSAPSGNAPSDAAVHAVLVKIIRRHGGVRVRPPAGVGKVPRRKRPCLDPAAEAGKPADKMWKRGDPPDYSRLKRYEASDEDLRMAGAESVDDLVRKVNLLYARAGRAPVTQGDYPASRKKFFALVARLARLEPFYGEDDEDACGSSE